MNELVKNQRINMINDDIGTSMFFVDEFKKIKDRYLNVKDDIELNLIIDEHDRLLDEELNDIREWMKSVKQENLLKEENRQLDNCVDMSKTFNWRKLTPKQQEVYEIICDFIDNHGYPPTMREISKSLGIKSVSVAFQHCKELETKGVIKSNERGKARTIKILKTPRL